MVTRFRALVAKLLVLFKPLASQLTIKMNTILVHWGCVPLSSQGFIYNYFLLVLNKSKVLPHLMPVHCESDDLPRTASKLARFKYDSVIEIYFVTYLIV